MFSDLCCNSVAVAEQHSFVQIVTLTALSMVIYNPSKVNICKPGLYEQPFQLLVSTEESEEQTGMAAALTLRLFLYSGSR